MIVYKLLEALAVVLQEGGFEKAAVCLDLTQSAPAVIFNRKDQLHNPFLHQALGEAVKIQVVHYVPAPEQFLQMIRDGYACGMVPDWQSGCGAKVGNLLRFLMRFILVLISIGIAGT